MRKPQTAARSVPAQRLTGRGSCCDFERATAELEAIVAGRGEHLRRDRPELQTWLAGLLG